MLCLQENLGNDIDRITWSLILALGVCYQARLRDRDEYRQAVAKSFQSPCRLPGGAERIGKEISRLVNYFANKYMRMIMYLNNGERFEDMNNEYD